MEQIPEMNWREKFGVYKLKKDDLYMKASMGDFEVLSNFMEEIEKKILYLKSKYGRDVHHNAWYHMIMGSTFRDNQEISYEDLPGEDSIADFIDNLQV